MTNANDVRRAHDLLDSLFDNSELSHAQIDLIRGLVPELPKQKTLEEIHKYVDDAWLEADDPELKEWLHELHAQLKGLKDTPAAVAALPAGMRLADHEQYGRVITSPKPNRDGIYDLLVPKPKFETGADWEYAHECELTFIDAEPAKPAHPEFLETEADYQNAPEGTIVACDDSPPWYKFDSAWVSTIAHGRNDAKDMTGVIREVLRWSWGDK